MSKRERWIVDYIPEHGIDILNSDFVDAYIVEFKPSYIATLWGALKCPSLNRLLARMYKKGTLERKIIGLGINWQPGFPRWLYVYTVWKIFQKGAQND